MRYIRVEFSSVDFERSEIYCLSQYSNDLHHSIRYEEKRFHYILNSWNKSSS